MNRPDLLFTDAAEHLRDSVVIANRDGIIVFANRQLLATYGYAAEEVVGQYVSFLKSGLMPPEVYADLWPQLLSGNSWRGRLVNRRKDGSLLDVELVISPVSTGTSPEWYIAIQRDMSAARKLERTVGRLATIGSLAAGIAHDLRGPLSLVMGGADLAQRKLARAPADGPPMDCKRELQLVQQGAGRIEALIAEILRLARDDADIPEERVYWADPIASALLVLGSADSGVAVLVEVEDGISSMASYVDLERVAMNLIDNALYAARIGHAHPAIRVQVARMDGATVLTVTDNGGGIAPEVWPLLFATAVTTKPADRGTGLGLLVVGELMRRHGGTVSVASSTSQGTTFRAVFPIKNA